MKIFRYFRTKLSAEEQRIYDYIVTALFANKKIISVDEVCSYSKIDKIINYILQDNLEFFYVNRFYCETYSGKIKIVPQYIYSRKKVDVLQSHCLERANQIKLVCDRTTGYDTLLAVHEKIVNNVRYKDDRSPDVHSIVSPLMMKYGVCDGYSKLFKLILDMVNIPCIVVRGEAVNPLSGVMDPHTWNMVKLNNSWCHFDITFDANLICNKKIRYDYFGLSNDNIKIDHVFNEKEYPPAETNEYDYFNRNNLVMKTRDQLINYLDFCFRNGIYEYVFKLSSDMNEDIIEHQVMEIVNDHYSNNNMFGTFVVSYNIKQKVFHIISRNPSP